MTRIASRSSSTEATFLDTACVCTCEIPVPPSWTFQLFHQRFEVVAGTVRHVIGVLEVSDAERAPQAVPSQLVTCSLRVPSSGSVSGHFGSRRSVSSDSSDLIPLQFSEDDQPIAVWIDSATWKLRIPNCTAIFTNIGDPLE